MVRALVPRVVYIVYGLVLYSLALISLERPSSPTALQTRALSKIVQSSYLSHPNTCSLPTHLHHPHLGPISAVNRLERSLALGARIPGTSDYMLRTLRALVKCTWILISNNNLGMFEMYPQHLSDIEPLRKFW